MSWPPRLDRVLQDARPGGQPGCRRLGKQVTARYDLGALVAGEIALLKRLARPG